MVPKAFTPTHIEIPTPAKPEVEPFDIPFPPKPTSYDYIPHPTEPKIVGETVIPLFLDDDPAGDLAYQIRHQYFYYRLRRVQYWDVAPKDGVKRFTPGTHPMVFRAQEGVEESTAASMERQVSVRTAADLNLSFNSVSSSLKNEISQGLKIKVSSAEMRNEVHTTEHRPKYQCDEKFIIVQWQQVEEYQLLRHNSETPIATWKIERESPAGVYPTWYPDSVHAVT